LGKRGSFTFKIEKPKGLDSPPPGSAKKEALLRPVFLLAMDLQVICCHGCQNKNYFLTILTYFIIFKKYSKLLKVINERAIEKSVIFFLFFWQTTIFSRKYLLT
jgi:hypothetical protein